MHYLAICVLLQLYEMFRKFCSEITKPRNEFFRIDFLRVSILKRPSGFIKFIARDTFEK